MYFKKHSGISKRREKKVQRDLDLSVAEFKSPSCSTTSLMYVGGQTAGKTVKDFDYLTNMQTRASLPLPLAFFMEAKGWQYKSVCWIIVGISFRGKHFLGSSSQG